MRTVLYVVAFIFVGIPAACVAAVATIAYTLAVLAMDWVARIDE